MIRKQKLWSTLLLIMIVCECLAIPADPTPYRMKQPDGTFVTLRMHGDEYLNYVTTADGFTVVRDADGFWKYASRQADGSLTTTDVVAHDETERTTAESAFLTNTPKRQAPKMSERMAQVRQSDRVRRTQTLQRRRAAKYDYSKFRGLVILVEYNDRSFMYGDEMNDIMNDILNKENYKGDERTNYVNESIGLDLRFIGSVYDYFRDNSNGLFCPKFDVVGPVKIDRSQYFVNQVDNAWLLAKEAVEAADSLVDFSQYDGDGDGVVDMVYFVYAGIGSPFPGNDPRLIWPHASIMYDSLTEDGHVAKYLEKDGVRLWRYACSTEIFTNDEETIFSGIGVICHEFSHVLGLPDFYDVDGEGSGGAAPDPAAWALMSNGGHNLYERAPCNLTLYERYFLGFCEHIEELAEVGHYTMRDVTTNEGFLIKSPNPDEFFIIEYRQQTGWDIDVPGHGMLVFRVDLSTWANRQVNVDPNHMGYELLFAGGYQGYSAASDPFPGPKNVTMLTNTTSPANLRTWDGKDCEFSLAHITEDNGVISFDLVNASTFKEIVMPHQQDLYEGICYRLEPEIYLPQETYETRWETDNPQVATVDQEGNVTAVAAGTAHIKLTAGDISATTTVNVQPTTVVPDFATLLTVTSGTPYVIQLTDAQVFYTDESRTSVYVRDTTCTITLTNFNLDLALGDVLNGRMYAPCYNYTDWLMIQPLSDSNINYAGSIQVTHGAAPEPDVVTFNELDQCKVMDYVKMEGVTLGYKRIDDEDKLCILNGERFIILDATFYPINMDMPSEEELNGKRYDIEAIISYINIPDYDDYFFLTAPITLSESTGIEHLPQAHSHDDGVWYDLQGRRVNAKAKGIVIRKGRKYIK